MTHKAGARTHDVVAYVKGSRASKKGACSKLEGIQLAKDEVVRLHRSSGKRATAVLKNWELKVVGMAVCETGEAVWVPV